MSRWFRFYGEALNDPKVQNLPDHLFKMWVNLLCVASERGGQLPVIHQLTYLLRRRSDRVERDLQELVKCGLIDVVDDHFEPHNWRKRQYKSDNSTERWHRWKQGKTNVGQTPEQTATDNRVQNTDTEQKKTISRAPRSDDEFQEFWKAYPKRASASPKKPARLRYDAARKRGVSHETILAGARAYATECDRLEKTGTQYVKTPEVWINQEGWTAFTEQQPSAAPPGMTLEQRQAWAREQIARKANEANTGTANGSGSLLEAGPGLRAAH